MTRSGTVRVAPYDASWLARFTAEAERLQQRFQAAGLPVMLEHMGSDILTCFDVVDESITNWMARRGLFLMRISLAIVLF